MSSHPLASKIIMPIRPPSLHLEPTPSKLLLGNNLFNSLSPPPFFKNPTKNTASWFMPPKPYPATCASIAKKFAQTTAQAEQPPSSLATPSVAAGHPPSVSAPSASASVSVPPMSSSSLPPQTPSSRTTSSSCTTTTRQETPPPPADPPRSLTPSNFHPSFARPPSLATRTTPPSLTSSDFPSTSAAYTLDLHELDNDQGDTDEEYTNALHFLPTRFCTTPASPQSTPVPF